MKKKYIKNDFFTKAGLKTNEDTVYTNDNFGFVIDGATGLLKERITDKDSDAQWFAEALKNYLVKNLGNNELSIQEVMRGAITKINNDYNALEGAENVKSRPSAGTCIYRLNGDKFEYFILGDCSLLVENKNGEITHLKTEDIQRLDGINIDKMAKIAKEKNINVIDARPMINDDLVKTRLSQNTKEGYWIVSDSLDAVDHALTGTLNANEISQIVGLSDGFSQIFDTFGIFDKETLVKKLKTENLQDLYQILWNKQEEDKFCNKFPRFKTRDDASALNVIFDKEM